MGHYSSCSRCGWSGLRLQTAGCSCRSQLAAIVCSETPCRRLNLRLSTRYYKKLANTAQKSQTNKKTQLKKVSWQERLQPDSMSLVAKKTSQLFVIKDGPTQWRKVKKWKHTVEKSQLLLSAARPHVAVSTCGKKTWIVIFSNLLLRCSTNPRYILLSRPRMIWSVQVIVPVAWICPCVKHQKLQFVM